MVIKKKRKKKTFAKNIAKKTSILALSALLLCTSVFSCYEMNVSASSSSEDDSIWKTLLITLVESGAIRVGETVGTSIGDSIAPGVGGSVGGVIGGAIAGTMAGGAMNAVLDWFENTSESGTREHSGGGRSIDYQYRKGVSTSQNTTNYNTTKNMSLYNETKTWNNTTNNYDYTYNWYNPITNTYNTTNNYTYNSTYNTYNYVTYDVDYTTNYYIQDNRTYVSYYIINTNNETQEKEETYVEMYYELPDGRNSLYLTVDDVKGQYFPTNYSKYISVAEDDGTTLGLWHLDGDLKDSSYWGNTSGTAYNNVYTDGIYSSGKKFSDSKSDFMELKLDKVSLPSSWTLEWLEYIPKAEMTAEYSDNYELPDYGQDTYPPEGYTKQENNYYYYDGIQYLINYDLTMTGYLGVDGSTSFAATTGYFVPYAMVCNNGSYKFYQNGNLVSQDTAVEFTGVSVPISNGDSSETWSFKTYGSNFSAYGIDVTGDSVRFYASSARAYSSINPKYIVGDTVKWGTSTYYMSHPVWNYYLFPHKNAIVDEVRLSSGALYTGDSYTPSTQPFTTNTVLAVPSNPQKHEIAFKTNTDISGARFGGARPTYPTNGYVYVALDADEKVESIQQYQEDGWYEIEASLYTGADWVSLSGFDMEYLGIDGVDEETGDDSNDNTDDGTDDGTGDDSNDNTDDGTSGSSGVQAILDGIAKFFDTLLNLVGKIIGLFSGFVDGVLELFSSFSVFTDGFSGFLHSAYGFMPPEAVNVIVSGITLIVILAIIKFLK